MEMSPVAWPGHGRNVLGLLWGYRPNAPPIHRPIAGLILKRKRRDPFEIVPRSPAWGWVEIWGNFKQLAMFGFGWWCLVLANYGEFWFSQCVVDQWTQPESTTIIRHSEPLIIMNLPNGWSSSVSPLFGGESIKIIVLCGSWPLKWHRHAQAIQQTTTNRYNDSHH